jgi:hypothetical protein
MSTFTRTTTPPFSANPLQAFVTYKQSRRAAKGAAVVAFVFGALCLIELIPYLTGWGRTSQPTVRMVSVGTILVIAALLFLLGWRTWVRPGPWKVLPVLILAGVNAIGVILRPSIVSVVIACVMLAFAVIAFRGALAMKGLQGQVQAPADLDVF